MSMKQQRQGFRLSVRKAVQAVTHLKSQVQTPQVQEQLLRKGILLTSYLSKLENFDTEVLEGIVEPEEIENEIITIRTFNETVEEAIADAQPISLPPPTSPSLGPTDMGGGQGNGETSQMRVNLPKLEIPPFLGDPIRWQEFWDAYKSAIHDRANVPTIDKLTYLRGLLGGEALQLVEGFRVTEANYREVVDVLTQRYGDKQSVIFAHIDALLSVPPATGDAASLVRTHTNLERHLRSLDSLQPDQDMILYSVILSKLPRFLKVEAHRKKGSQVDWSLAELRRWLGDEIRAREMGDRLHQFSIATQGSAEPSFKGSSTHRDAQKAKKSSGSATALVSQSREPQCPFCHGNHLPESCSEYPDTESRRAQLRDRCFSCLWKGHVAKACRRKKPCKFCRRTGHHSSFCFSRFGKSKKQASAKGADTLCATNLVEASLREPSAGISRRSVAEASIRNPSVAPTGTDSSVLLTSNAKRERTVMQTAIVPLENKQAGTTVMARLFFDTGSSRTFITENKRRELGLPTKGREWLSVSGFQSARRQTSEHRMVEFGVKCRDGTVQMVAAAVVPSITCPILKVPLSSGVLTVPEWSLAEPLTGACEYVGLDVLIGMDYYYSFVSAQRIQGGENFWFLSSKVGFLASGRVSTTDAGAETVAVMLIKSVSSPSPTGPPIVDLSKYWELEDIGMKEDQKEGWADEEAIASFSSTVKFVKNRYQVCWPWKTPILELKDNYGLALGRLRSLLNRLQKSPSSMEAYAEVFNSQLKCGIIEKAPRSPDREATYYMPHHCVLKQGHATTKIRIVFDASSKVAKDVASLNDCLHRGPVLLEDLCGLLLRFKSHPVALVSDIEKAFLQIGLQHAQRDATRFLWVQDPHRPPTADNVVVYRFCRVPFGVISSPFLLAATVAHHLKMSGSRVSAQILRDIYVDNVITGEATPSAAVEHYKLAKSTFREASMNLREWYSNSDTVLESILDSDKGQMAQPKVLGLRWDTKRDVLRLSDVKPIDEHSQVTKRSILKTLPQAFDPCGFLAPVVITGKLLLQDLWSMGIGWDDPVPQHVVDTWRGQILPNLVLVSGVRIPRYIGTLDAISFELHVFCDASSRACAASVYLRQERSNGTAKVNLLMAKSRLAPIKQKTTIPRLELIAVVLGARLLNFVHQNICSDVTGRFIWTDSQCVLYWLRKDRVSTRFIENRVKELRKLTNVQFNYTPTTQNPADLPTRGCSVDSLSSSSLWWNGPEWLTKPESQWPTFSLPQESKGDLTGIQATGADKTVVKLIQESEATRSIDDKRYSSLHRLLRVTAYVFRFTRNVRKPIVDRDKSYLLVEEINRALRWWIKVIQKESFPELSVPVELPVKKNILQLGIFRDQDGILRCSGRIEFADLPYESKHPILLPQTGHFTELVLMSYHKQGMHSGIAGTLARVRQQFWIVKGRAAVKRVIRTCRICRRFQGGPFRAPPVPPLPEFRLEDAPAFSSTGLDYLGPLFIRTANAETKKVWILLLTCAVTRAIHLEVTTDMTTSELLLALRRFIAMHGSSLLLVSDNGKQFRTASRLFEKGRSGLNDSDELQDVLSSRNIKWKFITEMAPWMGGFYERLVGIVKQALRKSISWVQVNLAELQTLVAEIAAVLNSRPLVYVEDEVVRVPLCPHHLISPARREGYLLIPSMSDRDFQKPIVRTNLITQWRRLDATVTKFWKTWKAHYLLSLRERHFTHGKRGSSPWHPELGTVVHLKQDLPRAVWRLGRIQAVHIGADGHTRAASVQLASGKVVRRPLKLLYPLELDIMKTERVGAPATGSITKTERVGAPATGSITKKERLTLGAAMRARIAWQQQATSESDEE